MNYRELEQAKRCQLLTGSFEGNQRACPCMCSKECVLSESRRQELDQHSHIIKRREENLKSFQNIT